MFSAILQDWITLQAQNGSATFTLPVNQSASNWLDLAPFEDVCLLLSVAQAAGAATLTYQTAPIQDDGMFVSLASVPVAVSSQPTLTWIPRQGSSPGLARFLRWQLTVGPSSTGLVTFRIVASVA